MAKTILISALLLTGMATSGLAQSHKAETATPATLHWGPAPAVFPKGAQMAVLAGDPAKAGPFTVRLKLPANYKIAAHHHPTYEAVTVLSGTLNVGMGDKLQDANAQNLSAGGFVNLPANMNHFAFSGDVETTVQINLDGPFAMTYVNPADDPTKTRS